MNSTCLDRPEATEQVVELVVGKRQRIAARDQDVADLRVRLDIGERAFPLRLRERVLAASFPDHARARAVAAVGRAEAGRQEQHPVGIAVDEAGHRRVVVLAERIVGFAGRLQVLIADRNVGAAQPVRRVVAVEHARVVGGDADRQRALVAGDGGALVGRQVEHPLEFGKRLDAGPQLPAPVIPFGIGRGRIVAAPKLPRGSAEWKRLGSRRSARPPSVSACRSTARGQPLGAAGSSAYR